MKKIICLIFTIIVGSMVISAPASANQSSSPRSFTGIGSGSYPGRASLMGINLSGFEIATGVLTESDGSAQGVFHAVLTGRTLLGSTRVITLEGNVIQGTADADSGSFSGIASMDLGDGIGTISAVPFSLAMNGNAMVLTIQSTVLPSTTFSQGGLDIE